MRVLLSAFLVFIVIFLTAVFFLSGMGERFLIRTANKSAGESVFREASITQYKSVKAPHYTFLLEGLSATPSLDLHLTTGHRLYDFKLMYQTLSGTEKGSRIKVEWCRTFASGVVFTVINGVSVVSPVDTASFWIWIFLTAIGFVMLAFIITLIVYSFKKNVN